MIIESIHLKNIKSYDGEGCLIDFRPGVNLIWGENGSGKTTILEAIGYCLFDALDYNLGQFIREGETAGEAILTFKHQDGRSYAIVREIRNNGGLKIRDVASGRDIINKRKDSEDWLNEQLGVEFGMYGRDLFQNAIGVPQGRMTGAFAISAGARKKIFDPILRVDEYDQAFKKLVDTKNHLDILLTNVQKDQSHLSGRLEQLTPTKIRVQDLIEQVRVGERDLDMAQEQIESLKEEIYVLDETLRRLGELDNDILAANQSITGLDTLIETAEAAYEDAQSANDIVNSARIGHEKYDQANIKLAELETRQLMRNKLREEIQEVQLTISRLEQQISGLNRNLSEVETVEKKILELKPNVDKQAEYEIQRNTARDQLKERDRILREVEELKIQIQQKRSTLATLGTLLTQRENLEKELQEKSAERENVLFELREINSKLARMQGERDKLTRELQTALLENQIWEALCKQRDNLTAEIEKDKQTLDRLRQQIKERDHLEQEQMIKDREKKDCLARLSAIEQEGALCKHKLDELRNHLMLLQKAESAECPVCRRSLSDLERDQVEADFTQDEGVWSVRLGTAQTGESDIKIELQGIDIRLQEIQSHLINLPLETQVEEIRTLIGEKNAQLEGFTNQINATRGICQTVIDLQSKNELLGKSLYELTNHKETLDDQRNGLDRAITLVNQNITSLPTETIKKTTEEEVKRIDLKIESAMSAVESLVGAEQNLENALFELEMLGDPRTELNRLSGIASRRFTLENELRNCEEEKGICSESQKKLNDKLLTYASLEEEIGNKKMVLLETEQDYRNYERNIQTALTLDARRIKVNELKQQHEKQIVSLDQFQIEKSRIGARFDPIYHKEIRQKLDQLLTSTTTLSAQLGEWRKQLDIAKEELSQLELLQVQLQEKEREVERLEKLKGVFEFVRNSFKRASPEIVSRRVRAISFTADRIFQEILGDLVLTLTWDVEYAIKAHVGQKERIFEQLSGGEQMAASIAVRLALLLHMSDRNIRWLFLDEPTTNLDDKRRDQLADRITRLEDLNQIFVITHDDAFDRETHHLIQLSKNNGVSVAKTIR